MIRFSCVHCGKTIQVKPELAGRKGKCPGCQAVLVIPAESAASSPSPTTPPQPKPTPPQRKAPPVAEPAAASSAPDDFSSFDPTAFSPSPAPSFSTSTPGRRAPSADNSGLPLGLGIGALALGVISLLFTCCLPWIQVPLALVGLGLGIFGIMKSKGLKGAPKVLPILGTVFSAIGLLLGIAILLLVFVGAPFLGENFKKQIEELERQQKAKQEMDFDLDSYPTTEE